MGAPVSILSERLRGKKGQYFTYLRHAENSLTGSVWVDVLDKFGGIKSFKPDEVRIITPKAKRKRKSSI